MKRFSLILIEAFSIALILFLSIRIYLIGNGYYEYADQYWSVIPGINSFASFVPNNGFVFTRIIVSWPVYFFQGLPSIIGEKVSVVYLVSFYFLIICVAIFAIRRILETNFHSKLSRSGNYLFFLALFIFIFTNLENQNLFVDGGMVTDSIISVLMLISFFIIFYNTRFWFLIIPSFLSISALLDPDYLPMFLILVTLSYLLTKLNNNSLVKILPKYISSIILFLPALFFILFNINISTGAFLTHSTGLRLFSAGSELNYSKNLNILSVLSLSGHSWSTLVFAPPSIYTHLSNLGSFAGFGVPIDILIIPGLIFDIWYMTLFLPFILSILSFSYPRLRRISVAGGIFMFVSVALTLYSYIPPLLNTFSSLVRIPYIGSYIGTAISLPGHFLMLLSVSYEILIITFLFGLLTKEKNDLRLFLQRRVKNCNKSGVSGKVFKLLPCNKLLLNKNNGLRITISILLIFILVFSGWQAFEGNFFPARGDAFSPILENGLVNSAPFQPRNMTNEEQKVYYYINSQTAPFNIYWPAIIWPDGQGWPLQKPEASLPFLPSMVSQDLPSDAYYYLEYSDVKYVVVENNSGLSYPGIPNLLAQEFGSVSFHKVIKFFNTVPNISQVFNFTNLVVYKISKSFQGNPSHYMVVRPNENFNYSKLYDIIGTMGLNPVITNSGLGNSVGANDSSETIDVISPINLSRPEESFYLYNNGNYLATLRSGKVDVSDISLATLGGNLTSFNVSSRNISIKGHLSSVSSITYAERNSSQNYNLSLENGSYYTFSVYFNLSHLTNVSYLSINLFDNSSGIISNLSSQIISATTGMKKANFILGKSLKGKISATIFVTGTNYSAVLENINYSLYRLPLDPYTPYGYYSVINGTLPLHFPNGKTTAYLLIRGRVLYSHTQDSRNTFSWLEIPFNGVDNISGDFEIASLLYSSLPLTDLQFQGLLLNKYTPFEVVKYDNHNIFPTETVNSLSFYYGRNLSGNDTYYYDNNVMMIFYILVVSEILVLLIAPNIIRYKIYLRFTRSVKGEK
jgi:hypothetical protein